MSNSPLVSYTKISPFKSSPRNHVIDTITIHCYVGQASVEDAGGWFGSPKAQCSCNYMIGADGRTALIVDEGDRSWCSSSRENDNRAVTIECACDKKHPYAVNEKVWASLILLCADICRRNGIRALRWKGDRSLIGKTEQQNMTVHRWFKAKDCPGEYLYSRHGQIAAEVNRLLNGGAAAGYTGIAGEAAAGADQMREYIRKVNPSVPRSVLDMIPFYISEGKAEGIRGDIAFAQSCLETGNFTFKDSAVTLDQNNFCGMGVTCNGMKGNSFDTPLLGIRAQIQHLKAYANSEPLANPCIDPRFKYVSRGSAEYAEWLGIQENPQGKGWAAGAKYGEKILKILSGILNVGACGENSSGAEPEAGARFPYQVRVKISDLYIRKGAGTNYQKDGFTGKGVFTIVEEADGQINGAGKMGRWGLLKSGQRSRNRWICLSLGDSVTEKV